MTEPTPIPQGYQLDAWHWLDEQGYPARRPPVRSSDYGLCLRDPFRYYLSRRLGLIPPLEWSPALNRGTWFHHVLAHFDDEDADTSLRGILLERKAELEELAKEAGKDHLPLWEREAKDMTTARAWWDSACCKVPMSKEHGTLVDYLRKPCWRVLGREVLLVVSRIPISIAQADLLLYNEGTNQVWILDAKTCSVAPSVRLATCPIEFQTLHYMAAAWYLMDPDKGATLQEFYGLPKNATLGGMIHAAVQKCPLEFGREDRPFLEKEHTLLRGPRKGQVEIRREYEGEPTFENYLQRQGEWYTGSGRYSHRRAEIAEDPPVNLSFTYARSALDNVGWSRYGRMISLIHAYAAKDPAPIGFPMNADNLRPFRGSRLSAYAPFYLMPVHFWPDIISRDGFQVVDRDADIPTVEDAIIEQEIFE
jgi:hypothetical protein